MKIKHDLTNGHRHNSIDFFPLYLNSQKNVLGSQNKVGQSSNNVVKAKK